MPGATSFTRGALAVVALVVPFVVIPSVTSTTIAAWTDRAVDSERLNIRENRPEVEEASARIADYYRQRGVEGPDLTQMTSTVLGAFARQRLRAWASSAGCVLSLVVGGIGLLLTGLLSWPRKSAG